MAGLPPHKEEIHTFPEFLIRQAKKLGVEIHLNHMVTPEFVVQQRPEAVIIATGGRQIQPSSIPIDPKITSLPAWKILSGGFEKLDQPVVVLGGGFVAAEITEYICEKGLADDITIVEMREDIAFDMEPGFRQMLIEKLKNWGVKMVPHFRVKEVNAAEVIGEDLARKGPRKLKSATVVLALGTESVPFPVEAIRKAGIKVLFIGDAKEPRGIAEAVRDGFLAGTSV